MRVINLKCNYRVISQDDTKVVLRDEGPWDVFMTITNDAEALVEHLAGGIVGRRLFYYDSEDELTEILVEDGKFAGFKKD